MMPVTLTTEIWRQRKERERQQVAAGQLSKEESYLEQLFPDAFIDRTEAVLRGFEAALAEIPEDASGHPAAMHAIQHVVTELNDVNDAFDSSAIETMEREELCATIEALIVARGIDIAALAQFHGCKIAELTDNWREW
jgi:hypothetical protein